MRDTEQFKSVSEWIAYLVDEDKPRLSDLEAFQNWLRANPENMSQFKQDANAYRLVAQLSKNPEFLDEFENFGSEIHVPVWRRVTERFLDYPSVLAGAMAVLVISVIFTLTSREQGQLFETGYGEVLEVMLNDGSSVHLQENSSLSVRFTDSERLTELSEGLATFSVEKDVERPFRVATSQGVVEVLGTQFDVHAQRRELKVVVLEGIVQVYGSNPEYDQRHDLEQGDLAVIRQGGKELMLKDVRGNLQGTVPWRIKFTDKALSEVINELNPYLDVPLELEDAITEGYRVSGTFRTANPEGILFALQETHDLQAEILPNKIVLSQPR